MTIVGNVLPILVSSWQDLLGFAPLFTEGNHRENYAKSVSPFVRSRSSCRYFLRHSRAWLRRFHGTTTLELQLKARG